jgi:hypothetical protein
MEARVWRQQFWTLSAWEGEEALQEFVSRLPYAAVMRALATRMGASAFLRWRIGGTELPLTWAAAHERERQRGAGSEG